MGNLVSVANEQLQPILDTLSPYIANKNITKKDVIISALVAYGFYQGLSFFSKCYQMHQIRTKLCGVPNTPSVITGNLYDVSVLFFSFDYLFFYNLELRWLRL